jgi:peptidyl-prolyl cis-trans isomerase D
MLNVLRKQAQSPLIQGIVLVIVIVFVFWGVGTHLNGRRNAVATVNDVEIPYQDYIRSYEQAVEGLRQQFGGQLPTGFVEQLGIKNQVLYRLIQTELLRQGGEQAGIQVSDLPVQKKVSQMKAFEENGKFNLQRYKEILAQNRLTPASFEKSLQADLLTERIRKLIGNFAFVPANAAQRWLAYENEEIKLAYVTLEPSAFQDKVQTDEKDLAAWFAKNKPNYLSEPKIRLKYLLFNQSDEEKDVQITEAELKAKYEENKEQYEQPEQRHARHILFRVPEGASEAERVAKQKEAEKVLALAQAKNADFAALAKQYSEDTTNKEQGGDLGFFAAGRMVPAFDKTVFSMQPGEVKGPVETQFGFHLIKLEAIRPQSVRSFDEVKDSIAKELRRQEAKGLTFKRAAAAYEDIMRAGSLDKYSEQGKEKVQLSEYFAKKEPPKNLPNDPKFLDAAFKLKKGELSSVIELRDGYAVLFADDLKEPELPKLEDVHDKVAADYAKEKAAEMAQKAAADLLSTSRKEKALQTAEGATVKETAFLKRSSTTGPDVPPAEVLEDAFKLAWKENFPVKPVQAGDAWCIYQVKERKPGTGTADEQMQEQLLAAAQRDLLTAWLGSLQASATIQINHDLLK